jgi:hypothetical protein
MPPRGRAPAVLDLQGEGAFLRNAGPATPDVPEGYGPCTIQVLGACCARSGRLARSPVCRGNATHAGREERSVGRRVAVCQGGSFLNLAPRGKSLPRLRRGKCLRVGGVDPANSGRKPRGGLLDVIRDQHVVESGFSRAAAGLRPLVFGARTEREEVNSLRVMLVRSVVN